LIREFKHQASNCLRPIKDGLHEIEDRLPEQTVPDETDWPQKLAKSLRDIEEYEWRLTRLIENMAFVSRLETPGYSPRFAETKLDVLVADVVSEFRKSAEEKDMSLAWWARPDPFPRIMANLDGLRQAFINLIDNAIKYCDEGDEVDIDLEAKETKNAVYARVSDTGPGIPEEDWDRIFERGYRVEDSRGLPPKEGGQGLGLYIVKQVVEKHGGTISVTSELGKGTTFIVTLRIRRF
jgi:signal transduction histidine kinase